MDASYGPVSGTTGFVVDIYLVDGDGNPVDLDLVSNQKIFAKRQGVPVAAVEWAATPEDGGVLRHVVPEGTPLVAGTYILNPYIELPNGFKGLWGSVKLIVLPTGV